MEILVTEVSFFSYLKNEYIKQWNELFFPIIFNCNIKYFINCMFLFYNEIVDLLSNKLVFWKTK